MIDTLLLWFVTPLSGASNHSIAGWTAWHARLMVLAWGILLPVGATVARFYKIQPHQDWPNKLDNKFWWHIHRIAQIIAILLMSCGFLLAFGRGEGKSLVAITHVFLGWSLCLCGWFQTFTCFFRGSKGGPTAAQLRGDHYDMSVWRQWFEYLHKGIGWLSILVSIPTIILGLTASDAPRWMLIVLIIWWVAVGIWFIRLQSLGRCIDTYQAIWGPEETHPGNRIPPIGWGVRRYTAQSWRHRLDKHAN